MRMPRIEKCDCGKDFDLDYSKPCSQCKSNYCEDCCKNGKKCVYCKSPTNKTDKLIESREMAWKFDFKNGVKAGLKYTPLVCRGLIQKIIRDFELIAQSAREEERERIKEKYGHFKYKCCVHSWDGCLRLQKELDYEKCFK